MINVAIDIDTAECTNMNEDEDDVNEDMRNLDGDRADDVEMDDEEGRAL